VSEPTAASPAGLRHQLGVSFSSLWAKHAGTRPRASRTSIEGNAITCALSGVGGPSARSLNGHAYKRDVIAVVTRLTHRRVAPFSTALDPDAKAVTVSVTLHPSLGGAVPMPSGRRARIRHRTRS